MMARVVATLRASASRLMWKCAHWRGAAGTSFQAVESTHLMNPRVAPL